MSGLFGSKPKPQPVPEAPKVNQEQVDRETTDVLSRRRGSAANILTGGSGGSTSGSVAAKSLLGS